MADSGKRITPFVEWLEGGEYKKGETDGELTLRSAFAGVVAGVEEQTGITALWGTPRS